MGTSSIDPIASLHLRPGERALFLGRAPCRAGNHLAPCDVFCVVHGKGASAFTHVCMVPSGIAGREVFLAMALEGENIGGALAWARAELGLEEAQAA